MTRVGLLTTAGHPLLGYLAQRMAERAPGIEPILIFDERDFSEKDRGIFAARTEGAFPPVPRPPLRSLTVPDHNGAEARRFVAEQGIHLLVNAGTPRRIKPELLAAAPAGVLNVHPGILPKYRGASCCEWAIYNDDPVGVTAHFMDAGLDSGPIIFTRELPVERGQSYPQVRVALYRLWLDACADGIAEVTTRGLTAATLPAQPDAAVFKPIPDELLAQVRAKLDRGQYLHAR